MTSAFLSKLNKLRKANNTITPPQRTLQIWDGGSSHHLIAQHSLDIAYNLKPLLKTIHIDGITGSDGILTHSCNILGLPESCNDAYYGQGLTATLLSLGVIQRSGGSYRTVDNSTVEITLPSKSIPPITVKLSTNNLLHVDTDRLSSLHQKYAQRLDKHLLPKLRLLSAVPRAYVAISAVQRRRAREANELHFDLDCIPDDALCKNITNGKIETHLTPADIRLNRAITGPCPHCPEGRAHAPTAHSSTSEPATLPGQRLVYDVQQLHTTAVGGATHRNTIVDEHSGFASVEPMINKTTQQTFKSLQTTAVRDYNTHGHKVGSAHGDAEQVNVSIGPHLNAIGIKSIISTPQHFARLAERMREHVNNKVRAIHARLHFHLPAKYNLLAEQAAVFNINRTLNSHSDPQNPLTPEEMVKGMRSKPPVRFGTVAMVRVPTDKSTRLAQLNNQDPKTQPRAEVAISMGHDPITGGTRFLLENELVVPRIPLVTLSNTIIPFGFKPKPPSWQVVEMPAEQLLSPAAAAPSPPTEATTPATTTLNSVIQLPNAINQSEALAKLTSHKQQADPNMLNEIRLVQPSIPSTLLGTSKVPTSHPLLLPAPPSATTAPPAATTTLSQQQQQLPSPETQTAPQSQQQQQQYHTSTLVTLVTPSQTPPSTPSRPKNPATLQPQMALPRTPTIMSLPQSPSPVTAAPSLLVTAAPSLPAAPTTPQPPLRRSARGTAHPDGYWKGLLASLKRPSRIYWKGLLASSQQHNNDTLPDQSITTNHLQRKGILNKEARAVHSKFRHNNPIIDRFTNKSTDIRPIPSSIQSRIFNLKSAVSRLNPAALKKGMSEEMVKTFETYKCFKLLDGPADKNAEFIRLLFAIKEKPTPKDPNNIRVRVAADGSRQPPHTYGPTHAATSDQHQRSFVIAVTLADCASRDCLDRLKVTGFDLTSAFINGNKLPREHSGGVQLITRVPDSPLIDDKYRDRLVEFTGPVNGLKQANYIFEQDLIKTLENAGFMRLPSAPCVFHKRCPIDPKDYITVPMNVDDGLSLSTSEPLLAEFKEVLTTRYGHIEFVNNPSNMCSVHYNYHENGISLDNGPYLRRALKTLGMDKVPPALTPSLAGFFDAPTDPTPASEKQQEAFATVNGIMVFTLPIRSDYRMETAHLCKSNSTPTKSDIDKQLQLLRYVKGTTDIGPFFSADPADHPNGVEISASTDVAFNVDSSTGGSRNAHTLQVGRPGAHTSPFLAYSAVDSTISLSPAEAEYISASHTAKQLLYWRQFAEDLGFPQNHPSVILEDNASAIKLANSPQIPTKSRHIALKFHHIRDLVRRKVIELRHCTTQKMVTDSMTKVTPPPLFLYNRSILFPRALLQLLKNP